MTYWQIYAFICDGKVGNIAFYEPNGAYALANMQTKMDMNDSTAEAVDVTRIPVKIGDDYKDGAFYRNGVLIERLPTDEEEVKTLKQTLEALKNDSSTTSDAVDNIIISMLGG